MSIEVLLMENVENLGQQGDVVQVADGYARNYLFPRNMGEPVTKAARARLVKAQAESQARLAEELAGAQQLANRLQSVSCTIAVKVGEDEKMFGSVTTQDIADAVKKEGVELDRRAIALEGPIKDLGVFDVPVKLHPDVTVPLKVWVVEE